MFKRSVGPVIQSQKAKKAIEREFWASVALENDEGVRKCIGKHVDINVTDSQQDNFTALHKAAEKGYVSIARVLLTQKNLKINAQSTLGDTPLMVAVTYNMLQFVSLLLRYGASPNIKNNNGRTALHIAVQRDYNIVTELFAYKAQPDVLDVFDNTPLSLSVIEYPSRAIAKCLLKNGANPNLRNMKGHTLLLELCQNCVEPENLHFVKLLLDFKANPNIRNIISKQTPLHMASIIGSVPLAKLLLKNGANPNLQDLSGRTPLDVATEHEHKDLIAFYKYGKRTTVEKIEIEQDSRAKIKREGSILSISSTKKGNKTVKFTEVTSVDSDDEIFLQQL